MGSARPVNPLLTVFSEYPTAIIIGTLGTAGIGAFWYVPPFYGPSYIEKFAGLPANAVTFSEMVCYIIPTLLSPVVCLLLHRYSIGTRTFLMHRHWPRYTLERSFWAF